MKFKVKDMDIATGGIRVVLLNRHDAKKFDLHHEDRVLVKKGKRSTITVLDIAESDKAVKPRHIGLFEEVLDYLKVKDGDIIDFDLAEKPESVYHIRKKLDGNKLLKNEIYHIVEDIVNGNLSEIELTYFVSACFSNGLDMNETVNLTKAIVHYGDQINLNKKIVVDKHCSGGVPGNRTTMVVVPIVAAAGLYMPKTSSRSITSPSGTADTMEVLAPVSIPTKKLEKIIHKVRGCIVWGGGMNLATADDKLIKVRHPLSLDPQGMLLASIMAKKSAVNSNHVLIDIPVAHDTKIKTHKQANALKHKFIELGKRLGMKVKVIITNGKQPIGNGIGPALEARDVLWLLKRDEKAPKDLEKKSLLMAADIFQMAGIKNPKQKAKEILDSGLAYEKMKEIIVAQGGRCVDPECIQLGKYTWDYKAYKKGVIKDMDNIKISKIARISGAPKDKGSGIYLYEHEGHKVKKGQKIFTIYSESEKKLKYAKNFMKRFDGVVIG